MTPRAANTRVRNGITAKRGVRVRGSRAVAGCAGARSAALEALTRHPASWSSRASVDFGRDGRQAIPPQPVLRRHARRFQIVRRPAPRGIVTTLVRRIGRLMLFHHRQRSTQPFVLDNRSRRHGLDLVEHPKRQRRAFKLNREPAIRIVHHIDLFACQPTRERRWIEQQHHPVVV